MTRLTIYGGVGEVGGNQVLVESKQARILLDFGTRMGYEGDFFAEFVDTRSSTALKDRLTIGALPKIPGIYWDNLVRPTGIETLTDKEYPRILTKSSPYLQMLEPETYEVYKKRTGKPYVNALFLTHAHMDHAGAIEYLDPRIPLYCTEDTKIIIETIDEVTSFKLNALTTKSQSIGYNKEKATFPNSPKLVSEEVTRECKTVKDGKTVIIEDMTIKLIEVDHSIPGAASFVIETSEHKILYTGDFRFHGTNPMTPEDYVKKVGKDIDVMICEGTRIASEKRLTEAEVGDKISDQIKVAKGLVLIDFSWKDTTRYETIRDAAKKAGRTFVINGRLAVTLKKLGFSPSKKDNVRVFLKRKGSALYSPADYAKCLHEYGLTTNSEKDGGIDSSHYNNGIVADDLRAHPDEYVVMMSYYDMGQIFDLADVNGKIPGSVFIKAQCEPFCDEMEIDEERLMNWLDKFGIAYIPCGPVVPDGCINPKCNKLRTRMDRSHVSGHAARPELKEIIALLGPKVLIPVHSENPDEFSNILKEIKKDGGPDIKLVLPKYGVTIENIE